MKVKPGGPQREKDGGLLGAETRGASELGGVLAGGAAERARTVGRRHVIGKMSPIPFLPARAIPCPSLDSVTAMRAVWIVADD